MENSMKRLGRYLLEEKIASGGMADVYRAKLVGVEGFEKNFAIKKILPQWSQNHDFIKMLVDEAKILLQLNHSNIVQVLELNREGPIHYIVMEYVSGCDLRALLKSLQQSQKKIPVSLAIYIIFETAKALNYAHQKQSFEIIHRDISPQNILLSLEGEVKVTDFGIARVVGQSSETITGTLKGKFAYMSPEQAMGLKLDHRSDIYSLGLVFYELLSGQRCFQSKTDINLLNEARLAEINFNLESLKKLSPDLIKILQKLLHRDLSQRYQILDQLLDDLREFQKKESLKMGAKDLKKILHESINLNFKKEIKDYELPTKKDYEFESELKEKKPLKTLILSNRQSHSQVSDRSQKHTDLSKSKSSDSNKKKKKNLHWIDFILLLVFFLLFYYLQGDLWYFIQKNWGLQTAGQVDKEENFIKQYQKPTLKTAELHLNVMPGGAQIELSGQYSNEIFQSPLQKKFSYKKSLFIKYRAFKKGYYAQSGQVMFDSQKKYFSKEISLKKIAYGSLNIKARPWGLAKIEGLFTLKELPYYDPKIEEGSYDLVLTYPPMDQVLRKKINIKAGKTLQCHAEFLEKLSLNCF